MISRSLGIETGGAIGIPLYIALALSVALYTIGFAESIVGVFPSLDFKTVGMVTTVGVATLAMVSAKVAIRAQYFIMFGIVLSLLSLFFGSPVEESSIEMWGASDRNSESFWIVFAVFYRHYGSDNFSEYYKNIQKRIEGLPTTLLDFRQIPKYSRDRSIKS